MFHHFNYHVLFLSFIMLTSIHFTFIPFLHLQALIPSQGTGIHPAASALMSSGKSRDFFQLQQNRQRHSPVAH